MEIPSSMSNVDYSAAQRAVLPATREGSGPPVRLALHFRETGVCGEAPAVKGELRRQATGEGRIVALRSQGKHERTARIDFEAAHPRCMIRMKAGGPMDPARVCNARARWPADRSFVDALMPWRPGWPLGGSETIPQRFGDAGGRSTRVRGSAGDPAPVRPGGRGRGACAPPRA